MPSGDRAIDLGGARPGAARRAHRALEEGPEGRVPARHRHAAARRAPGGAGQALREAERLHGRADPTRSSGRVGPPRRAPRLATAGAAARLRACRSPGRGCGRRSSGSAGTTARPRSRRGPAAGRSPSRERGRRRRQSTVAPIIDGVEDPVCATSRRSCARSRLPISPCSALRRQDEPGQREVLQRVPRVEALEGDVQVVEDRDDEGEADGRRHEDQARPARLAAADLARPCGPRRRGRGSRSRR